MFLPEWRVVIRIVKRSFHKNSADGSSMATEYADGVVNRTGGVTGRYEGHSKFAVRPGPPSGERRPATRGEGGWFAGSGLAVQGAVDAAVADVGGHRQV